MSVEIIKYKGLSILIIILIHSWLKYLTDLPSMRFLITLTNFILWTDVQLYLFIEQLFFSFLLLKFSLVISECRTNNIKKLYSLLSSLKQQSATFLVSRTKDQKVLKKKTFFSGYNLNIGTLFHLKKKYSVISNLVKFTTCIQMYL